MPSTLVMILYLSIEDTDKGDQWLHGTVKMCTAALNVVRRICGACGGATEKMARRMVKALVVERIYYGAGHYWLQKAQWRRLDTLCDQAMCVIPGLPRYTPVQKLRECAQLNKIYDVVIERKLAHCECLKHSSQGRRIAERLYLCNAWNGVDGPSPPLPEVLPPWEDLADEGTVNKPMPKTRRKKDPDKTAVLLGRTRKC